MSREELLKLKLKEAIEMVRKKKEVVAERNEAVEELKNAENVFSSLHGSYEQVKRVMANGKTNEKVFEKRERAVEEMVESREQKLVEFKEETNRMVEKMNVDFTVKLNSLKEDNELAVKSLRHTELHGAMLQVKVTQKQKENDELNELAFELIGNVGDDKSQDD